MCSGQFFGAQGQSGIIRRIKLSRCSMGDLHNARFGEPLQGLDGGAVDDFQPYGGKRIMPGEKVGVELIEARLP
jgi:hypothetical protein